VRKKLACITVDIEPDLRDPLRRVLLFEDSGLWDRYTAIVRAHDLKVTGFLVTSLIDPYGPALDQLRQQVSIEYALHSHSHRAEAPASKDEIKTAFETFQAFFGTVPLGYRAPFGLIDRTGILNLISLRLQYDSSAIPTLRPDEYGYAHLHLPNAPYQFVQGDEAIVELPPSCLEGIRLAFSLSYVKLFGWRLYRTLMAVFPLPDVVVLCSHPYDFYASSVSRYQTGWKRVAHWRNADQAFDLFEQMIELLIDRGFEFGHMSELSEYVRELPDLRKIPVHAEW
jgi:peptidoglycan/xylan/chitin deacetylase (PgdA/CDA1 family)